jgi:hypothetical protein
MAVPYTFGSATTSIPLSQLDSNFATTITLGNTAIQLGNTVTTLNNMTLANVTISSGTSNLAATSISNGTSNVTVNSSGGNITLGTAGTTAITVDTSQNVGIGGTPSAWRTAYAMKALQFSFGSLYGLRASSSDNRLGLANNTYQNSSGDFIYQNDGYATNYLTTGGQHQWNYASSGTAGGVVSFTQAMTLDSGGNLLLGTTSQYNSTILTIQKSLVSAGSGAGTLVNVFNNGATSTTRTYNSVMRLASSANGSDCNIVITDNTAYNYFFGGYNGTAYVTVGNTQGVKLSAGGTSWASDSDERLKNIKQPITNALANLGTLRTVYGNYKDDAEDVSRLFLIAQDVQKVYPEAIDVYTDEQQTLGLRAVDLIPVLVASIKELKAINDTQAETINALTARIVALEAK